MLVLVLGLLALTACLENHTGTEQVVKQSDCYTCHVNEYNATGLSVEFPAPVPVHKTSSCSTDCIQCHTTTTWINSLGGCVHPESNFPLASRGTKHTNIKCTDCHKAELTTATVTSVGGGNTDCISCHPNTSTQAQNHVGVTYDSGTLLGTAYSYKATEPNFCLVCHPNGLAVGHGTGNPFPLPHHSAKCVNCHDPAVTAAVGHAMGLDVTCVASGCHRTHADPPSGTGVHGPVTAPAPPSCIQQGCHQDGRSHGG
jgi:hypothetical protein